MRGLVSLPLTLGWGARPLPQNAVTAKCGLNTLPHAFASSRYRRDARLW